MRLEMMKVKVGADSMPRRLSWGVAKSLLLQIIPAFESDKPSEQTQTVIETKMEMTLRVHRS